MRNTYICPFCHKKVEEDKDTLLNSYKDIRVLKCIRCGTAFIEENVNKKEEVNEVC